MSAARPFPLSLLVLGPIVAACTGGAASSTEPGAERAQVAAPQAIFEGRLESGDGDGCKSAGPLFTVGAFAKPQDGIAAQPIKDGESFEQGTVRLTCSVTPSGASELEVTGDLTLSGANGGRFQIAGKLATLGEQAGVRVVVTSGTGETHEQADCTVSYSTTSQGVAVGRVWGEVTCPVVVSAANQTSCRLVAQFRFENCAQE